MIPIFTFDQAWSTMVFLFTHWFSWAQNWTVSLSVLDWQNFTKIMHDQWVVDVAGTGWQWIVIWQLIEAFFATIGSGIVIFIWWVVIHICLPWAGFAFLGILGPITVGFGYLMYLTLIYIMGPAIFVLTTNDLLKLGWKAKILYIFIWTGYIYLLFNQTPTVILVHPGWYLLVTTLLAIGLRNYEPHTTKTPI